MLVERVLNKVLKIQDQRKYIGESSSRFLNPEEAHMMRAIALDRAQRIVTTCEQILSLDSKNSTYPLTSFLSEDMILIDTEGTQYTTNVGFTIANREDHPQLDLRFIIKPVGNKRYTQTYTFSSGNVGVSFGIELESEGKKLPFRRKGIVFSGTSRPYTLIAGRDTYTRNPTIGDVLDMTVGLQNMCHVLENLRTS